MADFVVKVVDGSPLVVKIAGVEFLLPFINQASGYVEAAEASALLAQQYAEDAESVTGAHVIDFAGGASEGQPVYGDSSIASPDARYDFTVDGSGYLNVENIAGAIVHIPWQSNGVAKINRTFSHAVTFPTANFTTNAALGFCFDDSHETGAQATVGVNAIFLHWRANAVVQVVDGSGAVLPGYVVTQIGATAAAAFAGNDIPAVTWVQDQAGSGLFGLQKGVVLTSYRITPAPPGRFVSQTVRFPGGAGTPGSGSNYHALYHPMSWADSQVDQTIIEQTVTNSIGTSASGFLPNYGSPIRYGTPDANALVPRVVPPGFPTLPIVPMQVNGPGDVLLSKYAIEAYTALYPELLTGDVAYVSPTGGSPGSAALNDRTKPYDLNYALQSLSVQRIIAVDGDYGEINFRDTHTYGGVRKLLLAERLGGARIRVPTTDALSGLTYTATGGHAGVYQAAYAGTYAGVGIQRMVRTDILDYWGYPARILRCASLSALDAVTRGYYVDTATKTIYIKYDGLDPATFKASLKGYWFSSAGTARVYMQGTELGIYGFVLDGVSITANIGSGSQRPKLWLDNCEQLFAPDYGISDIGGAGEPYVNATRWRCHAPAADGINMGASGTLTGTSLGVIGNCWISDCGDFSGLGVNGSANKQAVSDHGGLFTAHGCLFDTNYGQEVADTSLDAVSNLSWYVGCLSRRITALTGSVAFGFYGTGSAGAVNRKAWIDTCDSAGTFDTDLALEAYASAKVYNSPNLTATVSGGSVAPVAYTPDAP